MMGQNRSSEADSPILVQDRKEIARLEAENTLKQFDESMGMLRNWLGDRGFRLKVSMILKLNRVALDGLSEYAGNYRPAGITIKGSRHKPVDAARVPEELEALCEYVTREWSDKTAIHLSAYVLWRVNWIHPFVDGNGRTARALSYLVLCAKLGYRLPGRLTIPEQIAQDKKRYYEALEDADRSALRNGIDVSSLENMIDDHLANQLYEVHLDASGNEEDRVAVPEQAASTTVRNEEKLIPKSAIWPVVRHLESYPVIYGAILAVVIAVLTFIFGR